jgi:molybdopterin/thiamine biosynthesis adenylyltransferase
MRIKVIGAGGIASCLLPVLARFLNYHDSAEPAALTIVDGDSYEAKNATRQVFTKLGNKAEVKAHELRGQFDRLSVMSRGNFVTARNALSIIEEGDIVFLCVDNHATRKLVSDTCESLDNVVLISGGNRLTDGDIIVYIRKDGLDVTLPLTNDFYHPDIAEPQDRNPADIGCDEHFESAPQIIFMNNAVACAMLNAYYSLVSTGNIPYSDAFIDIATNSVRPVCRTRD